MVPDSFLFFGQNEYHYCRERNCADYKTQDFHSFAKFTKAENEPSAVSVTKISVVPISPVS